jgi:hypothetical protein
VSVFATDYATLVGAARQHFSSLDWDGRVRLYYIPNDRDVSSRRIVTDNESFDDYLAITPRPTVFLYVYSSTTGSPADMPSPRSSISVDHSSRASTGNSSTRGHLQTKFRDAVRQRDKLKCVVTGERVAPAANNVHAAHIVSVKSASSAAAAGAEADEGRSCPVYNKYDTCNGILLAAMWHAGFDKYDWCMDSDGFIHVHPSAHEKAMYQGFFGKRARRSLRAPTDPDAHALWPTSRILAYRYRKYLRHHGEEGSGSDKSGGSSGKLKKGK